MKRSKAWAPWLVALALAGPWACGGEAEESGEAADTGEAASAAGEPAGAFDACALVPAEDYTAVFGLAAATPLPQPGFEGYAACAFPAQDATAGAAVMLTVAIQPGMSPGSDYYSSQADSIRSTWSDAEFIASPGSAALWGQKDRLLQFVVPGYLVSIMPADFSTAALADSPLDREHLVLLAERIIARLP